MRSVSTDAMAEQLTLAYQKSGMLAEEFVGYLQKTRDIFDIRINEECQTFFIEQGDLCIQFYHFNGTGTWHCKC